MPPQSRLTTAAPRRSRVLAERGEQRGFPDPGDAVHGHDQRPVTLDQFEQHRSLRLPADHGGRAGTQQCSQGPAQGPSGRMSVIRQYPPRVTFVGPARTENSLTATSVRCGFACNPWKIFPPW